MADNVFSNSRVNVFSNTLKLHTKAHTAVRGRPTLKDVERFRNGSNLMRDHELYGGGRKGDPKTAKPHSTDPQLQSAMMINTVPQVQKNLIDVYITCKASVDNTEC